MYLTPRALIAPGTQATLNYDDEFDAISKYNGQYVTVIDVTFQVSQIGESTSYRIRTHPVDKGLEAVVQPDHLVLLPTAPSGAIIIGTSEIARGIADVIFDHQDRSCHWTGDTRGMLETQHTERDERNVRLWVDSEGETWAEDQISWAGFDPQSL